MPRVKLTTSLKVRAYKDFYKGKSVEDLMKEYGMSETGIRKTISKMSVTVFELQKQGVVDEI